ncbi:MAG: SLBB domain-containing protein [Verrucomicrobia bacterium]|nr:SLBB domain-containing protein [Verrucomicrobiota bacterium]
MKRLLQMTVQGLRLHVKRAVFMLVLAACLSWAASAIAQNTNTNASTNAVPSGSFDILRAGERLLVILTDIPMGPLNYDQNISEDGYITLHLDKRFLAAGKTRSQLQKEITDAYKPNFYVRITVTVKQEERFFYVSGQVRAPNRYMYSGEMTVLKAIATSGGFGQFPRRTQVQVTRAKDGRVEIVDCKKAEKSTKLDLPIYPGDKVYVPDSPLGLD